MASGRSLLCSSVTCLSSQPGLTGAINEQTWPLVFVSLMLDRDWEVWKRRSHQERRSPERCPLAVKRIHCFPPRPLSVPIVGWEMERGVVIIFFLSPPSPGLHSRDVPLSHP